jgi:hypothetical protein
MPRWKYVRIAHGTSLHRDAEQVTKLDLRNIVGDVFVVLQVRVGYVGRARWCRYIRLI